jgi:ribosomal protein S12 methylthiotransferase accessory factor
MVWDITSDVGIAAFRAVIFDEAADATTHPFPAAFGAGCHPDRVVALTRALTEAAQSRLTVISGSRDDFGRPRYIATQSPQALAYNYALARAGDGPINFCDLPTWVGETLDSEINYVARSLQNLGLHQVLYVDLSAPELPIAVARVIVPGLEGPTESPLYTPGKRTRAILQS